MKTCVFAGSFDPFTVGHADTVEKCLGLFDKTIVAIAENHGKTYMFSAREREEMIRAVYRKEPRVEVRVWEGVIADLLREVGTPYYVRGIRNAADFEYECADFYASRDLSGDMVTLCIPAEQKYLHVSSTLVKNCIRFGKPFDRYVPAEVAEYLKRRLQCS